MEGFSAELGIEIYTVVVIVILWSIMLLTQTYLSSNHKQGFLCASFKWNNLKIYKKRRVIFNKVIRDQYFVSLKESHGT